MASGENIGGAWYELSADDSKLREALERAENDIRQAGQEGEAAFGDRLTGALDSAGASVGEMSDRLNSLSGRGPEELAASLDLAEGSARDAVDAIANLAQDPDLPVEDARQYADALDEISVEAQQTVSELAALAASDPAFDTPEFFEAAQAIAQVGEEAASTAEQLRDMAPASTGLEDVSRTAEDLATKLGDAEEAASGFGDRMNDLGTGVLMGVGIGAFNAISGQVQKLTGYFSDSVQAAADEEAGISRLSASIRANVPAWDGMTDAIEDTISAQQRQYAFSDGEQRTALARLVAQTHDVDEAFNLMRISMDLARFRGMDLVSASQLIGRVYSGNTSVLTRYGIVLEKGATATEALAAIQKMAGGQAEEFGNSAAGALASAQLAFDDLQEDIGRQMLPVMVELATFVRDSLVPALGAIIPVVADVSEGVGKLVDFMGDNIFELQVKFGDLGATIERVAQDAGHDVGQFKDLVIEGVTEMNMDLEAAQVRADEILSGIPVSMQTHVRSALAAWKQADLGGMIVREVEPIPGEVGAAMDPITGEMIDPVAEGADGAVAEVEDLPGEIAAKLEAGQISVAAAADELAGLIPAPMVSRVLEAVEVVRAMPGDIAQAILDGRDAVVQAANGLAAAATDPLVNEQRIAETRETIINLAEMTAEEITNATPASEAAREAELAQLDIALAGYLLRADPASKEAMGLLAKYAESSDPATQAAYEAMVAAIEERAFVLQEDIEEKSARTGEALPDALAREQARAAAEAEALAGAVSLPASLLLDDVLDNADKIGKAVPDGLNRNIDAAGTAAQILAAEAGGPLSGLASSAYPWGYNIGDAIARGMWDSKNLISAAAYELAYAATSQIRIESEPPDHNSPLYGITKWGGNIVKTIAGGIERELDAARQVSEQLASALRPDLTLAPAALPSFVPPSLQAISLSDATQSTAQVVAPSGSAPTIVNNYYSTNLSIEGQKPVVSTAQEILAEASRLQFLGSR